MTSIVTPDAVHHQATVALELGDVVLIYSDGVTDSLAA